MKVFVYVCGITVMVISMIITASATIESRGLAAKSGTSVLGDAGVRRDRAGAYTIFMADDSTLFFDDADVQAIWANDCNFTYDMNIIPLGDITNELLTGSNMVLSQTGLTEDTMWEGTYGMRSGRIGVSPLIVVSREEAATALNNHGLVQSLDGKVKYLNMHNLTQMMLDGVMWNELGVSSFSGRVNIGATNPLNTSNGFNYAIVLLNSLKNGVAQVDDIKWYEDDLMELLEPALGVDRTSRELFNEFIKGEHPLIVVPENMLVEYANSDVGTWKADADDIVLLYPVPTAWSSYTILAPKTTKDTVMDAFYNYEAGKLLWQEYGIRSSTSWSDELTRVMISLGMSSDVLQGQEYSEYGVPKTLYSTIKKQYEKRGEN